jgi:hypothetical protein
MRKVLKSFVENTYVEVEGKKIPAKIYREMRRDVRFSIARKGAILRMPLLLHANDQETQVANFRNWVRTQFENKSVLHDHFPGKAWQDGDELKIAGKAYRLAIELTENKTHTARLDGNVIRLQLTRYDTDMHREKAVKHLLSRIVAQVFLPEITRRVLDWNERHFRRSVRSVNLKYNLSNWGSCSAKGNINLSTRVLFAPDNVVDYVIVHELAHLVELNHSDRFWQVVEKVMPDYREKENWLKENWRDCDF